MKVFIVLKDCGYQGEIILAVFNSYELADAYIGGRYFSLKIEEYDVLTELPKPKGEQK